LLDTNSVGIWNNSVYNRTKKKTMKRSQLVKVIKEELGRKQTLNENLDAIITKYIETDDATELKAYFKSLPDKARTKLAKIFKIDLNEDGYERKDGKLVPHSDKFDSTKLSSILTRIAKDRPEEKGKYQGDPNRPLDEAEETLSASEIKEFVKQTLNLEDYDVAVRLYPNQKEIKLTIKQDPSVEDFNTVIEYLQDNGYTVDEEQSRREGDNDGDRYYYPRIVFK